MKAAILRQLRERHIHVDRVPATFSTLPNAQLFLRLEHLVTWHLTQHPDPDFGFVQVGAFNGQDQIHELAARFGLKGVAAEPQVDHFSALQETYAAEPQVELCNAAVEGSDGFRDFYRVKAGMPAWTQELASFDRDNILRHDKPGRDLAANIVCEQVRCVTFETLIGDRRCDLLQIDAEGYDAKLLELFDLERWSPTVVQFEHRHLDLGQHDRALRRLVDAGYRVGISDGDSLAYKE